MFDLIAGLVNRRSWLLVLGWLGFAAALYSTAPSWEAVSRDDDVRQFPAGYPSVNGQDLLEEGFPADVSSSSVVFVVERPDGALQPTDLAYADRLSAKMSALALKEPDVGLYKVTDRRTPVIGPRLISPVHKDGGQATLVVVELKGTYVSKLARLAVDRLTLEADTLPPPKPLRVTVTGSAAVGHDSNTAANQSMAATTVATIGLVVFILLVVYRSPLLALIPLATIGLSVATAFKAIALLTEIPVLNFQVIAITKLFVIVVLFGAGTDYCLFLIARYREELAQGRTQDDALREAIRQVGGALVASAGTVIVGLGMLWFSTFAKIRYSGPTIALSLVIALIASLTLAPVFLHWLRGAVFWPFRPPHHIAGADREQEALAQSPNFRFWGWVANTVVRHPGSILAASLLVLVPFAVVGARTKASYDLLADLDATQPSIVGSRAFERYWSAGELGPTTVLVRNPKIDFLSSPGRQAIAELTRKFEKVPHVKEVRSLTQPLGRDRDGKILSAVPSRPTLPKDATFLQRLGIGPQIQAWQVLSNAIEKGVNDRYVSTRPRSPVDAGHITRMTVVFDSNPFSETSLESLEQLRGILDTAIAPDGTIAGTKPADVGFAGTSILIGDLKRVTTIDERRMYVLVTGGVYLILVILLRRPGISLYLIATVILGYLASLGITELVFRSLHTGPDPWTGLDWKVGFFLFVILVAIGEDYNIFLMARVIEEEHKHGPIEGTRLAVAHTGGIISSCGLIMAGTFGAMMTGSLNAMRELGFALGLGVLLDTFIVRPVLVPAFVVLWHRTFPRGHLDSHLPGHDVPMVGTSQVALSPNGHAGTNGHLPVSFTKGNHPHPPKPW